MGIDLKLLASNFRERRGELLATASVRLDRDGKVLSLFSSGAQPSIVEPIPEGLKVGHYEDEGLRFDENDRHGERLTYTTSEKLRQIPAIDETTQWNRAALAFLLSLPPETKIVLYWC